MLKKLHGILMVWVVLQGIIRSLIVCCGGGGGFLETPISWLYHGEGKLTDVSRVKFFFIETTTGKPDPHFRFRFLEDNK